MKNEHGKSDQEFSAASIKKTANNHIVDASSSLLSFVRKLPEYFCDSSSLSISKGKKITEPPHQR